MTWRVKDLLSYNGSSVVDYVIGSKSILLIKRKLCGLKARGSKIKCKSQNKWFDQECETEKENLQSLGEKISNTGNTNNSELRQLLRDKKKRFKQTYRRKKRDYISKGMSNIDMQNSKETWRQIGKIFNLGKRKTHGAETLSTEQFYKYFKQQNAALLERGQL